MSNFSEIKDIGQAEELLSLFEKDFPDDTTGLEDMLNQMLDVFFAPNAELTGNADSFHNFSVSIKKIKRDNQDAYSIVKMGLKAHPANTDLLADALQYGYNCGQYDECLDWYQSLSAVDKKWWTWRAFSFSIDYLLKQYNSNNESASVEDMIALAKEYQERLPNEDDAWLSEAEVYASTNQVEKAIEVLESAIEKKKAGPKSLLKYADLMIEQGDFEKAQVAVTKMKRDPRTSKSINTSYMYYLDGLCRMSKIMSSPEFEDGEFDEKEILKVYKSFKLSLAMPGLRANVKNDILENIHRLELETEVLNPYGM